MSIESRQQSAINEYNSIVEEQNSMRETFEKLEQQRLLKLGEVQALTEIIESETEEPASKTDEAPE